ncbi:MAG TPA: prolyl oligopeptidase family serine peptidase [Terriglobales bacterium]|nr:prolyl oligopeptidase family serine peptidase [Terriglobales bacterium]
MRTFSIRLSLVLLLAVSLAAVDDKPTSSTPPSPPGTPVREVTDTYFGTKVNDPYRWLEDLKSPEVSAWMKAQNDYTRAVLDQIPGRDKLRARIAQLDNAGVQVNFLQSFGGRLFYLKRTPGDDNRKLYVRDGASGSERLLIDPETLTANGVHYSIDYYQASPDGKLVAIGISPGGSENSVLRVLNVDSGQDLGDRIDRAQFGAVFWLPDNHSFFYNRLQKLGPNDPRTSYYLNSRDYIHHLGDDPDKDVPVFGNGLQSAVSMTETDFPFIALPPNSQYAFGVVAHGVQNETTIYVARFEEIHDANIPWRKLVDIPDDVTGFDLHGDQGYFLSHHDASRYKVLRFNLRTGELSHAEVVIPPSEAVVTNIAAAEDALYVQKLDGGLGRLWRLPYDGGAPIEVRLPFDGAIQELFTSPLEAGAFVRLAGWTHSPVFYHYDPNSNTLADTKIIPPSPVDFSAITSEEVKAKASDGTLVPLSIIHQRDLKLDGSHPTLLHGYGSYGITYDPAFDPTSLAWLGRGGVVAVAHVRGGGEYGEDWHNAGRKATKMNTVTDFIACAQYLIEHRYTSPQHLAGEGTSAGGITIGGAITTRPDLFAAALDNVGDSDTLRAELEISGPANIPEFGTVKNEDEFHSLLAFSAYHHIKDHTAYPAVLFTTGVNDPRVDPWQMSKMTARLQAATTSGKPVLLRVDYDAGHGGIGATKTQHTNLLTDQFSFLLWQLGDPDFQEKSAMAEKGGTKK